MKNLILVFVVTLALALSSCSTAQSVAVENRTKIFNSDYAAVFKAAFEYCNEKGFSIVNADKELGILNTDWRENDGAYRFFFGNKKVKFSLSLKKLDEKSTKIVAIISAQESSVFGASREMTGVEGDFIELYKQLFQGIEKQITQ
jgi:uncharacterized lipoprotein